MSADRIGMISSFARASQRTALQDRIAIRKKISARQTRLAAIDVTNEAEWPRFVNAARRTFGDRSIARETGAGRETLMRWSLGLELPSQRTRILVHGVLSRLLEQQLDATESSTRTVAYFRRRHAQP